MNPYGGFDPSLQVFGLSGPVKGHREERVHLSGSALQFPIGSCGLKMERTIVVRLVGVL